jgi:2OG-Fe(II) oxygenase superfamily
MFPVFSWTTFDVTCLLPSQWKQDVLDVAAGSDDRKFPRTPVISREAADVQHVIRGRVHADRVANELPWLCRLYRDDFRQLGKRAIGGEVYAAADERYGTVLNVQRGSDMRFECHVDSNPLTGLLFCTDQAPGDDGELVFAHNTAASSRAEIERSCSAIRPQAGLLIFFDGRDHPHYVRPLASEQGVRIVAVMNYYTDDCPESTRPAELNRHLYGDK